MRKAGTAGWTTDAEGIHEIGPHEKTADFHDAHPGPCHARATAQDDPEYRKEIGAGVGLGGYLGDFNGSFTKDLEPMASIVGRYVINPHMALKMGVGLAKMKGSSADVMTYYPDYSDAPYTFDNKLYDV